MACRLLCFACNNEKNKMLLQNLFIYWRGADTPRYDSVNKLLLLVQAQNNNTHIKKEIIV